MATIENRNRTDGSTAYRLKWRYGGTRTGKVQSVTYADVNDAKRMKGAVEALGHLVFADDPKVVTFELVTGQRSVTYTAPTFGDVAEQYIDTRTRASLKTRGIYRRTLHSKVAGLVDLVGRPIEAITEDDIRRALNAITDRGRSSKNAYDLLRSVMKYALNKGMLPKGSPALYVETPKRRSRTANFLSTSEASLLVGKCRLESAALGDLTDVILGTGMRISEALGLIVADVHVDDITAGWLDVDQQLSRGGDLHRVPVKSAAGQRRIVLDVDTARVLARRIAGKRADGPVFPDPADGGWWAQHRVNQSWARARTAAQAEGLTKAPRVHDLRHTHAAWLITDGVSLLAVSRRLGHESIGITADTYGHLLPEADDAVRAVVAGRRRAMTDARPNVPRYTKPPVRRTTRRRVAGTRAA